MVPTPNAAFGNLLATASSVVMPQAERLSLQQEAQMLLEQIDQASGLLDGISQAPTSGQTNQGPMPLSAAIQEAWARMSGLVNRLSMLSQHIGTL
jgi:hypothetical protein